MVYEEWGMEIRMMLVNVYLGKITGLNSSEDT